MKKMLFLLLFLLILGAAKMNSQVRIGGNGQPNGAAVLDLNATDAINTGTKGLALPRVTLANNTAKLDGTTNNINGMLVYNTGGTLGAGIYYWNGSLWQAIMNGALAEVDGIVGNEITDTIANGGLTRSGAGTAASPYKVGIKTGGIQTGMIAAKAVTLSKIYTSSVDSGKFLMSNGNDVVSQTLWHHSGRLDTLQLSLNWPKVTWNMIMDTLILVTLKPFEMYVASVAGSRSTDYCLFRGVGGTLLARPSTNTITIWSATGQSLTNYSIGLSCYRTSI